MADDPQVMFAKIVEIFLEFSKRWEPTLYQKLLAGEGDLGEVLL